MGVSRTKSSAQGAGMKIKHMRIRLIFVFLLTFLTGCDTARYDVYWRAMVEDSGTTTGWFNLIFSQDYSSHRDCIEIIGQANPGRKVVCLPIGKDYYSVKMRNFLARNSQHTHCIARVASEDLYVVMLRPLKSGVRAASSGGDWYCRD